MGVSDGGETWDVEYYETESGRSPVFEWLLDMAEEDQALALGYIDQLAWLGMEAQRPLVRQLEGKLYELRWKDRRSQRRVAYFAASGRRFVLVHGFTKKQQKTPKRELDTARKRMKDYERRSGRR